MANITNAYAIKFSNERVRPAADLMAQSYYPAAQLLQRWTALGSGQAALDQMQKQLRDCANKFNDAYCWLYKTEKLWFLANSLPSLFPNDSSPVFDNPGSTAQDPNRPAITGAMVTNVVTRSMEFQNWLLSSTGSFTDSGVVGIQQVETATAVGTISGAGNATVVVTAAGMSGSPRTVSVAVANADTAATWAGKVRTALAADATVTAFFNVGGSSTAIVLTAKAPAANDATMNVSLANGTSAGITAAPTSANTTAGVAASRGSTSWLGTVLQCTNDGPTPIALADAGNFVNRCTELKTNYEANANANLNTILAVAVNPGNGG